MTIISIVGTSGVGKSFLVKRLASLDCLPAFFEGEEGVIPQEIFENIFEGDTVERFRWFVERYRKTLECAKRLSKSGMSCYVDGAPVTCKAVMLYEDEKHHPELKEIVDSLYDLQTDKIVLLTASQEVLKRFLLNRKRTTEEIEKALTRALKIQDIFLRLAEEESMIVIDRSSLDFTKEEDLRSVKKRISKE